MSNHISAKILTDTVNTFVQGTPRLTTFEIVFPRVILAEVNTHRALSKNTASSRAVPFNKFLSNVREATYIPANVGKNNKGMSSFESLSEEEQAEFEQWASNLFDYVADECTKINAKLNIHKQWINRFLEPWMYVTMIISGTDWANFFALRTHKDAHPDFQKLASLMFEQYKQSKPSYKMIHAPLVSDEEHAEIAQTYTNSSSLSPKALELICKISAGRCARVSYLTHDGKRDFEKDLELAHRLSGHFPKHMTPFEHVAFPMTEEQFSNDSRSGNFTGFIQYRKTIEFENITEFNGWD